MAAAATTLRSFTLSTGVLPGQVELVLSNHVNPELATTWLSLRLRCDSPYKRSIVLAQKEALVQVHALIETEIERLAAIQNDPE